MQYKNKRLLFIFFVFSLCRLLVSASQDGKLIIWDSYTTNKVSLISCNCGTFLILFQNVQNLKK